MDGPRKILVAVDESPAHAAYKAFTWALDNLVRSGDEASRREVHLVHVIPVGQRLVPMPDLAGTIGGIMEDDPELTKKLEEHAIAFLQSKFESVLKDRGIPYEVHLFRGDVSTDSVGKLVVSRAESLAAAAVVMAKHNRGRIKELVVGSCTSYVIHRCKQPVVVLHCD